MGQAAVQRRVQQRARRLDGHAAAGAEGAAGPAGIDQPAIGLVLGNQGAQQVTIFGRMARHEGGAEAGGEGRLRLLAQTLLGAGDLGGEAGQEVIHGLRRRQLGDRRQHAEGIGRQHDDVPGMSGAAGGAGVGNEIDRIGGAGVFGQGRVVQVERAGGRVHHHILQHGAEALGGGEDFRLGLAAQLDHLGIAAAFDVEDAMLGPTVFIVTHQRARRIGRQRGLAGAGKAEKYGRFAIAAHIGRAVHAHHPLGGQQIVHDGEDRLLHLAGIGGAADQDQLPGKVHRDHGAADAAMPGRIGREAGQVNDGEFRVERGQLFRGGADQQVVHEQRVPGIFGHHPHADPVGEVGAAEQILGEQLLAFGMGHHVGKERIEMRRAHRLVVVPPDLGFGVGVPDRELVAGGAAGMDARLHHQRTVGADMTFATAYRFFIQRRRAEVEVDRLQIAKAVTAQIILLAKCGVGHQELPVKTGHPYSGPTPPSQMYSVFCGF